MKCPNDFDVPCTPTWRNTLHNDALVFGHISELTQIAIQIDYPFICWNDRIYMIAYDEDMYLWEVDTGWTIDLLEFDE